MYIYVYIYIYMYIYIYIYIYINIYIYIFFLEYMFYLLNYNKLNYKNFYTIIKFVLYL